MLEEIHATPEDRRKTEIILALGAVGSGLYMVADAMASGWYGGALLGTALGAAGAAALQWVRTRNRLRMVQR